MSTVGAAALCLAAPSWAQPQLQLSWPSYTAGVLACNTQVQANSFTTARHETLYVFVTNLQASDVNIGTDVRLGIGPSTPDAWRFDDLGCQTGAGLAVDQAGIGKTCPSLKGTSPLPLSNFNFDAISGKSELRLVIAYDPFTPTGPATKYVAWRVIFDHSFSVVGAGSPPATCGGAEVPVCISSNGSKINMQTGFAVAFQFLSPNDQYVTWNSIVDCSGVPTRPSTWGRLKGLYR